MLLGPLTRDWTGGDVEHVLDEVGAGDCPKTYVRNMFMLSESTNVQRLSTVQCTNNVQQSWARLPVFLRRPITKLIA